MRLLSEQIYQLNISGDVAELGVFQGEFSSLISAAFPDRKIHLFDTFEGFSEKDVAIETSCNLSRARTGDFSSTDVDSVLRIMPDPARTVIHKGWFPDTLPILQMQISVSYLWMLISTLRLPLRFHCFMNAFLQAEFS